MKLTVKLNGNDTELEAAPEEPLMNVLRRYSISSIKCGCNEGHCGSCAVLLNDEVVATCKIPFGIIRNASIVTLDYFSRTEEYDAISKGFDLANIKLCGYCNSGKYLTAYHIITKNKTINKTEIESQIKNLAPCCTDMATLTKGIILSFKIFIDGYESVKKSYESTLKRSK